MEKKYGLDAISYLVDLPGAAGFTSRWGEEPSVEQQRKALQRGIAAKQRELKDLEERLRLTGPVDPVMEK